MLIVISGPSGSGKTTIVREMVTRFPDVTFSVSATTRMKRSNEREGVDYFFLTKEEFQERISHGDLVEWEEIFGNYYGTLRSFVDSVLAQKKHLLFDIDVNGALSIRSKYPDQSKLLFIKPPDEETLRQRLSHRGTDPEEIIARRLERMQLELNASNQFDYIVMNDSLQHSFSEVASIIQSCVR